MNNVIDFINTNRDRFLTELKEYLGIPSVSSLPEHKDDMRRCAEWTANQLRGIGLQNVRRRLFALHGDAAEVRVLPSDSSFRVELRLPAGP